MWGNEDALVRGRQSKAATELAAEEFMSEQQKGNVLNTVI